MQDDVEHKPRVSRGLIAALIVLAAIVVIAIVLIATGGSSHGTGTAADPATVIPASAPLYAGAVVRPGGALGSAAATAGRTLTGQADPYLRLLAALKTPGSAPLNFKRDVASWLGPRAGVFLSSAHASKLAGAGQVLTLLALALLKPSPAVTAFPFGGAGVQGAIVLDTSDVGKARSFLDAQGTRAGAHQASYRGVSYLLTAQGVTFGIVDRFAVIGSEEGLHDVVDTAFGGPPLAQAPGYAKLLAHAPPGALAYAYLNPEALGSSSGPQGLAGVLRLLAGTRESNLSLVPSKTSVALDVDALTPGPAAASGGLVASAAGGAQAAGELPAESWLAVGLGKVGPAFGEDVQGLHSIISLASSLGGGAANSEAASPLSLTELIKTIFTPLGVLGGESAEAKRDYQSWMGSAGIFAAGTGLVDLKAGVVISSTNPGASRAAVGKLASALKPAGASVQRISIPGTEASLGVTLPGFPVTLAVAAGRGANGQTKFVVGLSEPSVVAALNPTTTLAGAASYKAAGAALGEGIQPSVAIDISTFLGLVEGVNLTEEPLISKFVPYLRALTTVAGGGKSLGEGIERFRIVLGLQQAR